MELSIKQWVSRSQENKRKINWIYKFPSHLLQLSLSAQRHYPMHVRIRLYCLLLRRPSDKSRLASLLLLSSSCILLVCPPFFSFVFHLFISSAQMSFRDEGQNTHSRGRAFVSFFSAATRPLGKRNSLLFFSDPTNGRKSRNSLKERAEGMKRL